VRTLVLLGVAPVQTARARIDLVLHEPLIPVAQLAQKPTPAQVAAYMLDPGFQGETWLRRMEVEQTMIDAARTIAVKAQGSVSERPKGTSKRIRKADPRNPNFTPRKFSWQSQDKVGQWRRR
jgi:hypothetical protein